MNKQIIEKQKQKSIFSENYLNKNKVQKRLKTNGKTILWQKKTIEGISYAIEGALGCPSWGQPPPDNLLV